MTHQRTARARFLLWIFAGLLALSTGQGYEQQTSALSLKQLYASHYFETSLDVTVCLKDSERPKNYLITIKGSQQAGLTGFKGGIVRKVAVDKMRLIAGESACCHQAEAGDPKGLRPSVTG